MLMELHLLQSFAPSCLNRDDTNSPKDCLFGGVRRARISSQCLKRAIRWHPDFLGIAGVRSVRTKRLVELVCAALERRGRPPEEARRLVPAVLQELVGQLGPSDRTRALMYVGDDEVQRLTQLVDDNWDALASGGGPGSGTAGTRRRDPLQQLARQLTARFEPGTMAPDIALFGRMIAENAHLNVQAACQVAHAISTHRAVVEMDFFSAVDDLKPREGPGAEMIGTIEFNSACFYRYAAVSIEQLLTNLAGDAELAADTLAGFLHAAIAAVPSGRQNGMAAANPPSFVMIVARSHGAGWSLANAFEHPVFVSASDRLGLVAKSVIAADTYWGKLADMYGEDGIAARPACWLEECPVQHLNGQRVRHVRDAVDVALAASGLAEE
ncbi:type I-E CRISPR-associated protein Cas7/Cse4/CasC [bacterium]|nr:type I-E CRISPR-associated protein Cas7/Cse4/CasC [bacterium]